MLLDYQNTTFEVRDARPETALLVIGATEQEGTHLPVGSATLILDAVARGVAAGLPGPVYLLPSLPFGTSAAYLGTPGTISLSWSTMLDAVTDVVEALLDQGLRRVAVISGLGGATESSSRPRENFIVKTAVRQLNYAHPEADVLWAQPFTAARAELMQIMDAPGEDLHAGELTTSLLLHLAPELVQGRGADHVPGAGPAYLDYVLFSELCPGGVWGRPSLASAEKGRRAFEAAVERTIAYIGESFEYLARAKGRC